MDAPVSALHSPGKSGISSNQTNQLFSHHTAATKPAKGYNQLPSDTVLSANNRAAEEEERNWKMILVDCSLHPFQLAIIFGRTVMGSSSVWKED